MRHKRYVNIFIIAGLDDVNLPPTTFFRLTVSTKSLLEPTGVPNNLIVPTRFGSSSSHDFVARAAPSEEIAIKLCPQAWPMPGSASYSCNQRFFCHRQTALKETIGAVPSPYVATKAVSSPAIPRSTTNPCFSRNPMRSLADLCSRKAVSAKSWISSEIRRKSESCFEYDFSMIEGIGDSVMREGERVRCANSCIGERCSRERAHGLLYG